ncbi:hypothetical protein BJ165DRAFT_1487293 [Panaeolus papilionaceus]|nr:hypothetical protein BJ165DRAFT_1487293 [Panaeolus papilionaceus]
MGGCIVHSRIRILVCLIAHIAVTMALWRRADACQTYHLPHSLHIQCILLNLHNIITVTHIHTPLLNLIMLTLPLLLILCHHLQFHEHPLAPSPTLSTVLLSLLLPCLVHFYSKSNRIYKY